MPIRQAIFALSLSTILPLTANAREPVRYSLDDLTYHPYRFVPPNGHASQSPGSPQYFVPGYGYRIPGFGFRGDYAETLISHADYYRFGRRDHGFYSDTRQRFWSNSYGGPWYYPGWPGTTRTVWPDW
jgi:hypothetical protein